MSRPIKLTVGIVVGVLVLAGGWVFSSQILDSSISGPSYRLALVTRGDLTLSVSATGTLSPLTAVEVGSQVSGTIHAVYADFNSTVRKGQVIAQIEPSLFEAEVAQALANVDSAIAAQEKAWVGVEEAKRNLERARTLHRRDMMAESEVDATHFAHQAARVEHKVKTAAVAQAKAALAQARVNLAHTRIYSPIDGVVLSRDVDVGQTVAASLQAPTLFTIAQDLRRMQIETDVDEAFIGTIREGQNVSFTVFAYPNEVFSGQLVQIRLNPRVESEVVLYNCIIHVDNADGRLKPGMTAIVTIQADHRENVLKVPNAALRYVPNLSPERFRKLRAQIDLGNDEALLWTPGSDGVSPLKVKVGLTSDRETQVSGNNLAEGTQIVLPGGRRGPDRKRTTGLRLF